VGDDEGVIGFGDGGFAGREGLGDGLGESSGVVGGEIGIGCVDFGDVPARGLREHRQTECETPRIVRPPGAIKGVGPRLAAGGMVAQQHRQYPDRQRQPGLSQRLLKLIERGTHAAGYRRLMHTHAIGDGLLVGPLKVVHEDRLTQFVGQIVECRVEQRTQPVPCRRVGGASAAVASVVSAARRACIAAAAWRSRAWRR
jgi:hypothetical protein